MSAEEQGEDCSEIWLCFMCYLGSIFFYEMFRLDISNLPPSRGLTAILLARHQIKKITVSELLGILDVFKVKPFISL